MNVTLLHSLEVARKPVAVEDRDAQQFKFALIFAAALALLITLVPLIGGIAIFPLLLIMIPLVIWGAFRDTEKAIYVYLAWCWFDGTIRGLLHSNPASIVARDIVLGIIVVGWGFQRLQNRHQDPIRVPPGTLLVALFGINCFLQLFNPFAISLLQSIGGLKVHLSAVPLLFLGYDVIRRPAQVRSLFLFLVLITLVMGFVSYAQYVHGPSWTWAHFPGSQDTNGSNLSSDQKGATNITTGFKPPATTTSGGGAGAYAGVIFAVAFVLPLMSSRLRFSGWTKIGLLGALLVLITVMFINGVRAGLAFAICSVLISSLLVGGKLRIRMLAAIAVCLVLGGVAYSFSQGVSQGGVTNRFATTFSDPVSALHKDRRTFFEDAAFIFINSPTGVGLGRVGAVGARLGNSSGNDPGFTVFSEAYLGTIMYETGIIGGVLIIAITLFFIGRNCIALQQLTDPDDKLLATAVIALLTVIFANFFVTPILLGSPGSVLFWLLSGASLRAFGPKVRAK